MIAQLIRERAEYERLAHEVVSAPGEGAERLRVPFEMQALAAALMIGVFYVGLYPRALFDAVDNATRYLFV